MISDSEHARQNRGQALAGVSTQQGQARVSLQSTYTFNIHSHEYITARGEIIGSGYLALTNRSLPRRGVTVVVIDVERTCDHGGWTHK